MKQKIVFALLLVAFAVGLCACGSATEATSEETKQEIEEALNIANNTELTWSYNSDDKAWVMSIVSAVTNPELEDYQGVSVAVPSEYIKGIDTDGDGTADVTAKSYEKAVNGTLVIDEDASIKSENGQTYTAATAPVIVTTGAAGYSAQENQEASTSTCSNGYINVACGNRGKQSTATDDDGNEYYTGDAPDCLVDQKNAIRFVKYNILLGNLPGNTEYFVSTGGSGGGAHATLVAATSNNSDYYDYEISQGAVGVYSNGNGSYSTTVTIDGEDYEISDGVWGCVAYSAITSLSEADMTLAFEYYLDSDYDFNTTFQKQLASYLSEEYMDYINDQNMKVKESEVSLDINGDGDTKDTIKLSIEYDEEKYADTNGYGGTYLDLYLAEFQSNLQWYLDNLDYADDWTWFDEDGDALSDKEVAAMTSEDKAEAFIEGRYAKSDSGSSEGPDGDIGGGKMTGDKTTDGGPTGEAPTGDKPIKGNIGDLPDKDDDDSDEVGTPDAGTTQSSSSSTDSSNYSTYDEMLEAYEEDISSIEEGDEYGNNQVDLYNPLNYIGDSDTDSPTWSRIVMGASEGDMSMFSSMNLMLAWLDSGTDATIEWQWDGGHVPSEIFGESLSLYIDEMYGTYVDGASEITKAEASSQTTNGSATEATGTDISSWVSLDKNGQASFTLADIAKYRTDGASKSTPGFDVIDYGQETYEFGNSDQDARHFDKYLLNVLKEHADELSELFNKTT